MDPILCIDVGNTHLTWGIFIDGAIVQRGSWKTENIRHTFSDFIQHIQKEVTLPSRISFCSVVPDATEVIQQQFSTRPVTISKIDHTFCPHISINYPSPHEIGPDRLANAISTKILFESPAIIVDLGTAVTLDYLSGEGVYEGGIIAPGLSMMTRYFHEKTALLPLLDPNDLETESFIGKSTVDAMKIGTAVGFEGLIHHLLDQLIINTGVERVIATGGDAKRIHAPTVQALDFEPDLTLLGLGFAISIDS